MNSILLTIRSMLGLESNYDGWDLQLINIINSIFLSLHQLGVGPTIVFSITGLDNTWDEFVGVALNLEAVKTYIYLKTRIIFDPPTHSYLIDAINKQIEELEWRLREQTEYIEE